MMESRQVYGLPECDALVEAGAGPERRIAAIRLPTLRVADRFIGGSDADRHALLARPDRAMHRGGG